MPTPDRYSPTNPQAWDTLIFTLPQDGPTLRDRYPAESSSKMVHHEVFEPLTILVAKQGEEVAP